jgi:ferredoxin-NADP reductase/Na+-transporting NADH:ubiquinone oxidoreductase subunit NqrB
MTEILQGVKSFIDRTTMYRLVLYYLLVLLVAGIAFGVVGILPYAPLSIIWSAFVLILSAWLASLFFSWAFDAIANTESFLITALILTLILQPVSVFNVSGTLILASIAVVAMASKYFLAIGKRHLFNPAAFAAALSGLVLGVYATWWVAGNIPLLPFILVGGLMVVQKLRKFDLIAAFGAAAIITVALTALNPISGVWEMFLHSALLFFAFVMLTEPLTMPPTRRLRIAYGILVGILFVPGIHIGSYHFAPEIALLVGNLFAYALSPGRRHVLSFVERRPLASGIYEYLFKSDQPLRFIPGQYLEWTLDSVPFDSRGNRRFFTIASAPEDELVALGVRLYDTPSAFKRTLNALPIGGKISVASLSGDFTLPSDPKKKLAFLAGGIGVTPFASMARHLLRVGESRDAVLLYASKTDTEMAYRHIFGEAARVGLRTVYTLSDEASPGAHQGFIDAALIKTEIPDYAERLFYVSGPPGMVDAMKKTLLTLGVSRLSIKTDFFPGLA